MMLHIAQEDISSSNTVVFSKSSSSSKKEQLEDEGYLLRLSHTYQWDQIQDYCTFLIQSIQALQQTTTMTEQRYQQQEPWKKNVTMTTTNNKKKKNNKKNNKKTSWLNDDNSCTTVLNKFICLIQAQLYEKDQWGNTSLHVICHHKPPNSIVSSILFLIDSCQNHRENNNTNDILTMTNSRNATPLLIACLTGASCTVIRTLLSYLTTSTSTTNDNSIVQLPDTSGMTSILSLLLRYELKFHDNSSSSDDTSISESSTTVGIPDLFYPNFFAENDDDVETIHNNHIMIQALKDKNEQSDNKKQQQLPRLKDLFNYHSVQDHVELLLDCVDELFQEAWRTSSFTSTTTADVTLLHLVANVADSLPPTLTDLLIQRYYNTTTFAATTSSSNTPSPLHIAIGNGNSSNSNAYHYYPQLIYNRNYFIRHLLLLDPKSAQVPLQLQSQPRTPFCHAIEAGWTWHISTDLLLQQLDDSDEEDEEDYEHYYFDDDDDNNHNIASIDDCTSRGVLQKLFKCAPDALTMKDPITNLYPFAIAATVAVADEPAMTTTEHDDNDDLMSNHRDLLQLDTIYNLLRLHPQAIVS